MATTTTNYGLTKPAASDNYDIAIPNANMDAIDAQLKADADKANEIQDRVDSLAGDGHTTETVAGNADAIKAQTQAFETHAADDTLHSLYAVSTNTDNDYAVTLSPVPTAYKDGMAVRVKINADSTGTATLNVNGLGKKPVYDSLGNAVTNFKANTPYQFCYESSADRFIVLGKGGGGTAQPENVAAGMTFTNDIGTHTGTSTKKYGVGDNINASNFGLAGVLQLQGIVALKQIYDFCIDPVTGDYLILTYAPDGNIKRYSSDGVLIGTKNIVGGQRIAVDSLRNVYVTHDNGSVIWLEKMDSSFTVLWNVQLIYGPSCTDLKCDSDNNVYVILRNLSDSIKYAWLVCYPASTGTTAPSPKYQVLADKSSSTSICAGIIDTYHGYALFANENYNSNALIEHRLSDGVRIKEGSTAVNNLYLQMMTDIAGNIYESSAITTTGVNLEKWDANLSKVFSAKIGALVRLVGEIDGTVYVLTVTSSSEPIGKVCTANPKTGELTPASGAFCMNSPMDSIMLSKQDGFLYFTSTNTVSMKTYGTLSKWGSKFKIIS